MAIFAVEGKLGTGKTKFCVWRAQTGLREGLRIASNVDLDLGKLVPELQGAYYSRIPDKPTAEDLVAIGHGNPSSYDEEKNGLLILDELGSWLNTRTFQDKARMPVIDWLIHARKHGWHVFFICQDASMIDAQVRNALIEYSCRCRRLDKVKIPFFGDIFGIFNKRWAYMPRMHLVAARIGDGANIIVAERWNFRGDDLHAAYDTRQVFTEKVPPDREKDGCTYGYFSRSYSSLHSGYFLPRVVKRGLLARLRAYVVGVPLARPPAKTPHPVVALVMKLPADQRMYHMKRLMALGVA